MKAVFWYLLLVSLLLFSESGYASCEKFIFKAKTVNEAQQKIKFERKQSNNNDRFVPYWEVGTTAYYFECNDIAKGNYFQPVSENFDEKENLYFDIKDVQEVITPEFVGYKNGFVELKLMQNAKNALNPIRLNDRGKSAFSVMAKNKDCWNWQNTKVNWNINIAQRHQWSEGVFNADVNGDINDKEVIEQLEKTFKQGGNAGLIYRAGLKEESIEEKRDIVDCLYYGAMEEESRLRSENISAYTAQDVHVNDLVTKREQVLLNLKKLRADLRDIFNNIISTYQKIEMLDMTIEGQRELQLSSAQRYKSLIEPHSVHGVIIRVYDDSQPTDLDLAREIESYVRTCALEKSVAAVTTDARELETIVETSDTTVQIKEYYKSWQEEVRTGELWPSIGAGKNIRFDEGVVVSGSFRYIPSANTLHYKETAVSDNGIKVANSNEKINCEEQAKTYWIYGDEDNFDQVVDELASIVKNSKQMVILKGELRRLQSHVENENKRAAKRRKLELSKLKARYREIQQKIVAKENDKKALLAQIAPSADIPKANGTYNEKETYKEKATAVKTSIVETIADLRNELCVTAESCGEIVQSRYCVDNKDSIFCAKFKLFELSKKVLEIRQFKNGLVLKGGTTKGKVHDVVYESLEQALAQMLEKANLIYTKEVKRIISTNYGEHSELTRMEKEFKLKTQDLRLYLQQEFEGSERYVYFLLELASKVSPSKSSLLASIVAANTLHNKQLIEIEADTNGWFRDISKVNEQTWKEIKKQKEDTAKVNADESAQGGSHVEEKNVVKESKYQWQYFSYGDFGRLYDVIRTHNQASVSFSQLLSANDVNSNLKLPALTELNDVVFDEKALDKIKAEKATRFFINESKLEGRLKCAKISFDKEQATFKPHICDRGDRIRLLLISR